MKRSNWISWSVAVLILLVIASLPALAQGRGQEPGKSIGKVSVVGNLVLLELDEGALGHANMFDLQKRTLRFRPEKTGGYRVENLPLAWDAEFGTELSGPQVTLKSFAFPFSGKTWDTLSVGSNGSIRFGAPEAAPQISGVPSGRFGGGVSVDRFAQMAEAGPSLVNANPALCVFFKPRMSGPRYLKELADRAVITWDVTEPWGNIQDFTWVKTVNRFQAVLHKDGTIEMSYDQLTAKDGVVGVYPVIADGKETALGAAAGEETPAAAPHLDLRSVKLAAVDGLFLKVTLETRGPALAEGDPALAGVVYRVYFAAKKPLPTSAESAQADATWTIVGFGGRGRQGGGTRYFANGPGVARGGVKVSGNAISVQGTLPPALRGADQVAVYAEAIAPGSQTPADQIAPKAIALKGIRSPEVHFSAVKATDGPFPTVYESFHYLALPNARDMTCSVLKALGDKFDFLAYYSDFRVDNQEAGTPSTGPLGSTGPAVTGIGAPQRGLESFCSAGRFQWQFIQPVYVGSNQMMERPPADAPVGPDRDITFYAKQLGENTKDGSMPPYMYAMSQIGHEMGHRWSAFVSAKVGNETIQLGPTHWARGLQAPVAFPYMRPTEASIMGGGVWQDNFDGTFTQLDDDYYVPATGWSYLDLYLMGLITPAEVPDFFILRNLQPAGRDGNGHPIFKADRTKVTIQNVIDAEGGVRFPGVDKSQREFNTGMVMVVEHGQKPSQELIERTEAIRKLWIDYFAVTTGRRASMTAIPQ